MSWENIERGHYLVGDKEYYFRSKWEYHYALYLEWLKSQKQITDWKYEVEIFEFPIKHGTTRYLPDFQVTENDGRIEYHEVKGYLTSKAKTQLKRMAKYHPQVKVHIIDRTVMKDITSKLGRLLNF